MAKNWLPRERSTSCGAASALSDISHWWPIAPALPINRDPSPIKILSTLWRTSPTFGGWQNQVQVHHRSKKSVIHSRWKPLTIYLIEGVTVHLRGSTLKRERLEWSKSEVILWNSSWANLVLKEIHFLVCFAAQQFYWREETKCRAGVKRRSHWDNNSFKVFLQGKITKCYCE